MIVAPGLLKRLSNAGWNVLYKASPVGYAMAVFMTYCAVAAIFEVKPKFAALLAGYGIVGGLYGTQRVGIIGYRLGFGRQFSFAILLVFLVVSSLISVFSSALAAWLGRFRGLDVVQYCPHHKCGWRSRHRAC